MCCIDSDQVFNGKEEEEEEEEMPCSAYTLSLATIASVISVALIAIAFSTDNWSRITVDRLKLEVFNSFLSFLSFFVYSV